MTAAQPALAPVPATSPSVSTKDASKPRLERLGRGVERTASTRGLEVEFLGVEELFSEARLYGEAMAPWVVTPAAADPIVKSGLPIPAAQRSQLKAVVETGMDFPHLYLAHELGKEQARRTRKPDFGTYRALTAAELEQLVVKPEAPSATRRTAHRFDTAARKLGRGAGIAAAGMGMAIAAPLLLAGAGLDPAILGALTLPGAGHAAGTPAAWFLLARWDW
jgi:hypothetical protein